MCILYYLSWGSTNLLQKSYTDTQSFFIDPQKHQIVFQVTICVTNGKLLLFVYKEAALPYNMFGFQQKNHLNDFGVCQK